MSTDDPHISRAKDIHAEIKRGEDITKKAAITAVEGMAKLTRNIESAEAKALALEAHAVYVGIGTAFMEFIVPKAEKMQDELKELGCPENTAQVLTGIFLAKVFEAIETTEW